MCRYLSNKYNVPIPNQDQLIMGIHSTYYLGSSEPFSHYLVFDKKQQFLDNVQLEFPSFYDDLQSYVKEFLDNNSKCDPDIVNHMIYTFMTHWEDLFVHLRKTKPKYDVFFMSNNDYEHATMLASIISDEFHSQLNAYIGYDISQIKDICPSGKYDLVVTNFPYENIYKTPVVCVENYPTPKDILTIRNELVMISSEKQA
ncbi:M protein trans-acting positive regulator PRD domain-containing protein [Jeotgalicoccus sp. S0W5]|uniref:M protein trans-acting positive regulator PRD domain-containing protein n=1 Tax=Jeotgalicoccus sp. S0W5 TaxID=2527874 RepID=UPI0014150F1D|nr:M protein trans-acting positive regulator PRD domain-containing protein [Jeotgalicoccus sp. S0W5]